jgi:hypothetical protein
MPDPRPLVAASERLRGKAGRPRKELPPPGIRLGLAAVATMAPRLLNLAAAARYYSTSVWTIRDLIAAGVLRPVRIELPGGRWKFSLSMRHFFSRILT